MHNDCDTHRGVGVGDGSGRSPLNLKKGQSKPRGIRKREKPFMAYVECLYVHANGQFSFLVTDTAKSTKVRAAAK